MIVQCDGCKTRFRVADEKVRPRGVRVRCTRCKNTFVVRPDPEAPGEPRARPEPAPKRPAPAGESAREASGRAEPSPPQRVTSPSESASTAEAVGGGASDPMSVAATQEAGEKFDLDDLLGKDFNLDLPPAPEESGEEQSTGALAPEAASGEMEQRPPGAGEGLGGDGDPDLSLGPGDGESEVRPKGAELPPEAPDAALFAGGPEETPTGGEGEPEPGADHSLFGTDPPSSAAGGGDLFEAATDFAAEEEQGAGLSDSLFEGLEMPEQAGAPQSDASLSNLFDGGIAREDAPVPTQAEVEEALTAFDSVFDDSPEAHDDGEPAGAGPFRGEEALSSEAEPGAAPRLEADSGAAATGSSTEGSGGLESETARSELSWEEPSADPSAAPEETWSFGEEEAAVLGEESAREDASAEDQPPDLDLDLDLDDSPGLVLGEDAPSPGREGGISAGEGEPPLDLGDAPGAALGGAAPITDGPPGLDLDGLPPLEIDGTPAPEIGSPDGAVVESDLDLGGDPFEGLDESPPEEKDALFGEAFDDSAGEADRGEHAAPAPESAPTPIGRIAVGPPSQQEPKPAEPVSEARPSSELRRRGPPLLAILANGLFALALIAVGLGAFVVFRTSGPLDASLLSVERVKEAFVARAQGPEVRVLTTGSYSTREGMRLLYMRGRVSNATDEEIDSQALEVMGIITGPEGEPIDSSEAIIGAGPTPEDLWEVSSASDLEALRARLRADEPRAIAPGEEIDFFVLFGEMPAGAESLRFRAFIQDDVSDGVSGSADGMGSGE